MHTPGTGQLFADRFRIEHELGAGGFARVFLAVDEGSGRRVALKILHPGHEGYDDATRKRFDREISLIARLRNPHVVTLFSYGTSPEGLLYMVFEHIPGEDLSERLERQGALGPEDVSAILRQLLGALREAHDKGLIHRDIKPQNIRVESPPGEPVSVKLLDFGIARPTDDGSPSITKTGELIGTPRYMSPEQLTDKRLTPQSDIYSLGMVAFEMLVGGDALPGNAWHDQLERLRTGHLFGVDMIHRVGPLLPIVQKMTAKRPEDRFPSAAAVLSALDNPAPTQAPPQRSVTIETRPRPRPLFYRVLMAIGLCAGFVLAAWLLSQQSQPDRSPPKPKSNVTGSTLVKGPEPAVAAPPEATVDVGQFDLSLPPVEGGSPGCGQRDPRPPVNGEVLMAQPYDPRARHPLVIWLMADQDDPMRVPQTAPFQWLIHEKNALVLVPRGATRGDWRDDQRHHVRGIAKEVLDNYCVNPNAVYVMSRGGSGTLSTALSCEPWVTAVAVSSFLGPADRLERCGPILWFSGKDSIHLPIEGGMNCTPLFPQPVEPLEKVERRLRKVNGCRGPTKKTPNSGGQCRTWNCEIPFESCLLDGGVGWPGTPQATLSVIAGAVGCDEPAPSKFDGTDYAWQFFQRATAKAESD